MGFGAIFAKTWKNYTDNFGVIFVFMLFYAIALSAFLLTSTYFSPEIHGWTVFLSTVVPSYIALLFVGFLVTGCLMSASIKFEKFTFEKALHSFKGKYWSFVAFNIVLLLYLAGLFILLIIPGIIFTIYWVVAPYIFLGEKKGIRRSLRESHLLVKGKWWRVFGYSILFLLIYLLIAIIFGILSGVIDYSLATNSSPWFEILSNFILVPLMILFYKNLYFELRNSKSKKVKK